MSPGYNPINIANWKLYFLGILISITVLMDPKLFFLYLTQSSTLGYFIFGVYLFLLLINATLFISKYKFPIQFWLIFNFCLFGIILDSLRGLGYGSIALQLTVLLCLPIGFMLYRFGVFTTQSLSKIFFIYSLLHLLFILFCFIKPGLINKFTAYGSDINLGYRSLGLFTAPGVLSFYSSIVYAYGIIMYKIKNNVINLLVLLLGIILGLLSGNRTFLISGIIITILTLLWSPYFKRRNGILSALKFTIFILILSFIVFKLFDTQLTSILDRFNSDKLTEDYETRLNGEVGLVPGLLSLTENPILGHVILENESNSLKVSYNNSLYTINNGFVNIFGFNGIPAGLLFFYIYFLAFKKLRISSRKIINNDTDAIKTAFYFMIIAGSIVCLGDGFLKSPIMLILIVSPFCQEQKVKHPKYLWSANKPNISPNELLNLE